MPADIIVSVNTLVAALAIVFGAIVASVGTYFVARINVRSQDRRTILDARLQRLRALCKPLLLQMQSLIGVLEESLGDPAALMPTKLQEFRMPLQEGWIDLRLAPDLIDVEPAFHHFYRVYLKVLDRTREGLIRDGQERKQFLLELRKSYEIVERMMRIQTSELEEKLCPTPFLEVFSDVSRSRRAKREAQETHRQIRERLEASPVATIVAMSGDPGTKMLSLWEEDTDGLPTNP